MTLNFYMMEVIPKIHGLKGLPDARTSPPKTT